MRAMTPTSVPRTPHHPSRALAELEPDAWQALMASHLESVPAECLERLVTDAIPMDLKAGALVVRESEASVALVVRACCGCS